VGIDHTVWVNTVEEKLRDVEVFSIRDFVTAAVTVNRRLQSRGFTQLHFTTIKLMLGHACDVLYEEEGFDPHHDADLGFKDYDAVEERAGEASEKP
jgi:hypothetical protein